QHGVKSLVIQFSLETRDLVFDKRQNAEGIFRLLRTPKGELVASYEITPPKVRGEKLERSSGLFNNGAVYILNHDRKTPVRLEPADGDLRGLLVQHFNPFVMLLNRKLTEDRCQLAVTKQDEWYTYLAVKPRQVKRVGWFPDTFHEGQVILMNKAA